MTARLFCFRKAGSGHDPQWRQLKLAARGSKHVNVITLGKLPIVNSRHLSATIGSPATVQNENSALRRRTLYFTLRLFWAPATSHINSLPRISNVRNRLRKAGSKQSLLLTSGLLSPVPSQARWRPVLPFFFYFPDRGREEMRKTLVGIPRTVDILTYWFWNLQMLPWASLSQTGVLATFGGPTVNPLC